MFAVMLTGGKQYKVSEGDLVKVEKLDGDVGATIKLDRVLMVGEGENVRVGEPYLSGVSVTGEVVRQFKDKKVIIFKKRRRKGYRRKNGHRQSLTEIKITAINK
jgi:large subunit ribosomal protein L21